MILTLLTNSFLILLRTYDRTYIRTYIRTYGRLEVTKYLFNDLALESSKVKSIKDFEVQHTLTGVCKASSRDDNKLLYWLFKHCSYALAPVLFHIFNLSLSIGRPPKA